MEELVKQIAGDWRAEIQMRRQISGLQAQIEKSPLGQELQAAQENLAFIQEAMYKTGAQLREAALTAYDSMGNTEPYPGVFVLSDRWVTHSHAVKAYLDSVNDA